MIGCDRMSDRMPAVARGEVRWSPDELAHLAGCTDCRSEWEVVAAAARLGRDRRLDVDLDAMAARVLHRVRHESLVAPRRRVGAWSAVGLAVAAALVFLLLGPAPPDGPAIPAPADVAVELEVPLPELERLGVDELQAVLETMDEPLGGGSTLGAPGLGDLGADELEELLESWEG